MEDRGSVPCACKCYKCNLTIRPTSHVVSLCLQFLDLRSKEKFLIKHVAIPILDLGEEVQLGEDSLNDTIFNMSLDEIEAANSSDDEASTSGLLDSTYHHTLFVCNTSRCTIGCGAVTANSHDEVVMANLLSGTNRDAFLTDRA